jgi:hypothetical protein
MIEQNVIKDVPWGLHIAGGDNNIFRFNQVFPTSNDWLKIYDYDNFTGWPCDEEITSEADIPANDPAAADYQYYFPHDCHSRDNQIYENNIQP